MNHRKDIEVKTWRNDKGQQGIWVEAASDGYRGPTLTVHHDGGSWLYLDGGDIEAVAMVNIEVLPELIRELQRIQRRLRKSAKP